MARTFDTPTVCPKCGGDKLHGPWERDDDDLRLYACLNGWGCHFAICASEVIDDDDAPDERDALRATLEQVEQDQSCATSPEEYERLQAVIEDLRERL